MLKRVRIHGYKSLADVEVQLEHSQHIVTTRDPFLPDLVPPRSLFVVERTKRTNHRTSTVPFPVWKQSRRSRNPREARRDEREHTRVWERIVRGDFGA